MIKTRINEIIGIEYPLFQGGMAWISDGRLAAAVSEAGGLGIIASGNAPAEYVLEQIRIAASLTDKPFGVNLMLMNPFADEIAEIIAQEKVKVVTTGAGNPLKYMKRWKEAGEVGEIVVIPKEGKKQTGVFCAYHENPQMYEHVWRNGIYHTGDSARIDEDGYFWFEGRIDDVIKTGGYRVGPFEIESVLSLHPAVVECSVVGVPDPSRGQAIKAVAVLDPAYEASKELQKEIKEFCNTRLAEYKWVRIVEFVKELPKTISGKTIKSKIRHE